jgi:crotonobetaine/carnitine-CoA ligase
MEFTASDVLHTALPMFHGNSLILTVYAALMSGAHAAVSRRFSASAFDAELEAAGATATSLLGAMGNIVVKQDAPAGARRLEKMLVIPVPTDLKAALQSRYGCRIGTLYGLADIGMPLFSGLDFPPDTCGRILAGSWEVRILGPDGTDVPPGTAGEFAARPRDPSATALGYWRMPAESEAQRRDGWLLSGDLMRRDEAGWFYFVDRAKDAIRRRGENVSSLEVEAAFIGHPQVLDCAVYPVPSEMAEDEIMLAVIPRPLQSIDPLALIRHAEERLPYFAVPRFVRIMDDFPRTATQKVQKVELRRQGRTADCWDREASGYVLRR